MIKVPELIVMLTHNDRTVEDAAKTFESAKNAPAKYWGFKEIGLPETEMKDLALRMREAGKTTFLEVVAYTEEECVRGAECAARCGFDYLIGTIYSDAVKAVADSAGMGYMPFVGSIHGRPSVLEGTIEGMIEEAESLIKNKGITGFDLLGYRFTGDAVKLNSEFARTVGARVVLAGSVSSYKRLDEVKQTSAWAFTIGGALFEKKFCDGDFADQITAVAEYIAR